MGERMLFVGKVINYENSFRQIYIDVNGHTCHHWLGDKLGILVKLGKDPVLPFITVLYVALSKDVLRKKEILPKIGEKILVVGEQGVKDWEHHVHAVIILKPQESAYIERVLGYSTLAETSVLSLRSTNDWTYDFLVFYSKPWITGAPSLEELINGRYKIFMKCLNNQLAETTISLARFISQKP